jgi:uncharacterized protein YwgA
MYIYGNMFLTQYVHLQSNNIRFKKLLYTTAFKDINNWDINFTLKSIRFYDKYAMIIIKMIKTWLKEVSYTRLLYFIVVEEYAV